jgi:hypothetical protein
VLVEAIGGVVWTALCWTLLLRIFAETAPRLPIVYSGAAILLAARPAPLMECRIARDEMICNARWNC